jgi:protein TonB
MFKYFLGLIAVLVITISCSRTNPYSNVPKIAPDDSTYYIAVEDMPEPIGGINAIQSNLIYPENAKEQSIEGKVYVLAYINENGVVEKTKIIKGLGYGMDEAASDAVKKVKFIPGEQNGNPVKVEVAIPIVFKLD